MASILVVDDDADGAELVARLLERAGHHVERAPDGREALALLNGPLPDVVILDLLMPVMDGVSFLEVLRSYLRWQHVPVIVVTAYPEGPRAESAGQFGVSEVVRKGDVDFGRLTAAVDRVLRAPPAADGPGAHPLPPPTVRP